MKNLYALLAVAGFVVPYAFFIRFLTANGLDLPLFFQQMTANDVATFFVVDLVISTVVFWIFVYRETRRRLIRFWQLSIVASLVIGLSCALPLFLYLRESAQTEPNL